jgi:hypothetical protein
MRGQMHGRCAGVRNYCAAHNAKPEEMVRRTTSASKKIAKFYQFQLKLRDSDRSDRLPKKKARAPQGAAGQV